MISNTTVLDEYYHHSKDSDVYDVEAQKQDFIMTPSNCINEMNNTLASSHQPCTVRILLILTMITCVAALFIMCYSFDIPLLISDVDFKRHVLSYDSEELEYGFQAFDRDNDGCIGFNDLRATFKYRLGETLADHEVEEMLDEVGSFHQIGGAVINCIDRQQFTNLFSKKKM